jgi:N-methylhydantoinase A
MTQVIVPPHAGVLSAVGLALAPERRESLVSVMQRADAMSSATLGALLEREAHALRAEGDEALSLVVRWWLRARYEGQGYELDIIVQPGETPAVVAERFVMRHEERAGFVLNRPVEFISARTTLSSAPWPVHFARPTRDGWLADDVDDGRAMTRVIDGPAVVRLPDATMRVALGWTARALDIGGWMLEQRS